MMTNGVRLPACVHACLSPSCLSTMVLLRADGHAVRQAAAIAPAPAAAIESARANGVQFEQAVAATRRLLHCVARSRGRANHAAPRSAGRGSE